MGAGGEVGAVAIIFDLSAAPGEEVTAVLETLRIIGRGFGRGTLLPITALAAHAVTPTATVRPTASAEHRAVGPIDRKAAARGEAITVLLRSESLPSPYG